MPAFHSLCHGKRLLLASCASNKPQATSIPVARAHSQHHTHTHDPHTKQSTRKQITRHVATLMVRVNSEVEAHELDELLLLPVPKWIHM